MIAAMIVGPNRRRTYYRMWHKKNKAPSVESIVAWVKRLTWDSETLKFDRTLGAEKEEEGAKAATSLSRRCFVRLCLSFSHLLLLLLLVVVVLAFLTGKSFGELDSYAYTNM